MNQEVTPKTPSLQAQIEFVRGARHLLAQGITDNVATLPEHCPILMAIEQQLLAIKTWNERYPQSPFELVVEAGKCIEELVKMLRECKITIKNLHGLGMPEDEAEESWKIYDSRSPEMIRLNNMIAKYPEPESGAYEFKNPVKMEVSND